MAYVRRTDKLIDGIKRKISQMRSKAESIHASGDVELGTPMYDEVKAAVSKEAWQLYPALQDKMPDAWCYFTERVQVRLEDADGHRVKSLTLSTPDNAKMRLPCKPSTYYDEVSVVYEHQSCELRRWVSEEQSRQAEVRATREQYEDVERQIMAFLMTKTSLNAALKEMPELELYVPDEFMEKFREPNTPRTKGAGEEHPVVEVDRGQLAALGVAHRMMSAAE